MKRVTLDFTSVSIRYELHLALRNAFGFPDYYGMNLDALKDCLTDIREDTEVEILGAEELRKNLGRYGSAALGVIQDSAGENGYLRIHQQKISDYSEKSEENGKTGE